METRGSIYDALAAALGITPDEAEGDATTTVANLVMHVEWLQGEFGTIRCDFAARSEIISSLYSVRTERDALVAQFDGLRAAWAEMGRGMDYWHATAETLAPLAPALVRLWRRLVGIPWTAPRCLASSVRRVLCGA